MGEIINKMKRRKRTYFVAKYEDGEEIKLLTYNQELAESVAQQIGKGKKFVLTKHVIAEEEGEVKY